MSKRKKITQKKHSRKRRVGAINTKNFDVMGTLLVIGGALASKIVTNTLSKSTSATMQKAAPYAGVILGAVGMVLIKNESVKKISTGMLADGGVTALGSTGLKLISGIENTIAGVGYPGRALMVGTASPKMIAGPAGNQGLVPGTRSNFSGSRLSQMNTIAGVMAAAGCN